VEPNWLIFSVRVEAQRGQATFRLDRPASFAMRPASTPSAAVPSIGGAMP
jgi:hypothetical protein